METNNIDDLISQIDVNNIKSPTEETQVNINLTDEEISEFVINNAAKVIINTVESIENLKNNVSQTSDPESIAAFSELIKASSNALDVLNKINLQNKKLKSNKELKKMEIDSKKQIEENRKPNNTNILIATREDIFKQIMQQATQESKIIDVDVEEVDHKNSQQIESDCQKSPCPENDTDD